MALNKVGTIPVVNLYNPHSPTAALTFTRNGACRCGPPTRQRPSGF